MSVGWKGLISSSKTLLRLSLIRRSVMSRSAQVAEPKKGLLSSSTYVIFCYWYFCIGMY